MKKALLKVAVMLLCLAGVTPAMAQFNLKKAVGGREGCKGGDFDR